MKKLLYLFTLTSLLCISCGSGDDNKTVAVSGISSAIFEIPTSLTGETSRSSTINKSAASDALVTGSVQAYYNLARSQVKIAHSASAAIREIIADLENVSIGGTPLFDLDITITHTENNGGKLKWTAQGNNSFLFEKWIPSDGAYIKTMEISLVRQAPHYSGSVIFRAEQDGWTASDTGQQEPHWLKIVFDNDSDGNGLQILDIYLQDFRFSADIQSGQKENAVLKFTKDSAGAVTLASLIYVPGSPHFVWDGYIKDSSGVEIVNPAISAYETRSYVITGKADASNHATINLSLPKAGFAAATVFSDYSIGAVLKQLFADKLNNNYPFESVTTGACDEGHEIISVLNILNAADTSLLLDTTAYSNNTPSDIFNALSAASTHIDDSNAGRIYIDYLIGIMSVQNPAYFNGSIYDGNGASVPAGYIDPSDLASLSYPTEAEVSALNIVYQASGDNPGF